MFDIAPSELMLVGVVALVVIGPKDLPKAMRFVGQWVGKARGMARHFRMGLDEMVRQAELEEMEKQWAATNARIMAEHPSPEPIEERGDADYAALPPPRAEAADEPTPVSDGVAAPPMAEGNGADATPWPVAGADAAYSGDAVEVPVTRPPAPDDGTAAAEREPELPMGTPPVRDGKGAA